MGTLHSPKLTMGLLQAYCEAALRNAEELLAEAMLLRDNDHMARAYFLSIACIEEGGKALLAFDAQNRNLSDPAVCAKLKKLMKSHGHKINYALGAWAMHSQDPHDALKLAVDLIIHLGRGREVSMYSDLRTAPDRAQAPREVVRDSAARDCVRLASYCLAYAHRHVAEKTPAEFTNSQDRLFTMNSAKFQEMLNREDFWWYYISRMKAGQQDLAEAVLGYDREHIETGTTFREAQQTS